MTKLEEYLSHLQEQHNMMQESAAERLAGGASPDEMAVAWAYTAGMHQVISTLVDGINNGDLR